MRCPELRNANLSPREKPLVRAMDVCTAAGTFTGVLTAVQGRRLSLQAPQGAVPVDTGTNPAVHTPSGARNLQRSLSVLGVANLLSGVGLVASTGLFWRSAVSRPPLKRGLRRRAR